MFPQQGFQGERTLDCLLHGGGIVGLLAIGTMACWLTVPAENPGTDSAAVAMASGAPLREVHAELVAIDRMLATVQTRIAEGSLRIPPEPRESEFLKDLMRIAKETDFTIRDYQPSQPKSMTGCPHFVIDLAGSGDYRSICRFLDQVSRLQRLTAVERLEITAEGEDAAYPVAITVAVYFSGRTMAGGRSGGGDSG